MGLRCSRHKKVKWMEDEKEVISSQQTKRRATCRRKNMDLLSVDLPIRVGQLQGHEYISNLRLQPQTTESLSKSTLISISIQPYDPWSEIQRSHVKAVPTKCIWDIPVASLKTPSSPVQTSTTVTKPSCSKLFDSCSGWDKSHKSTPIASMSSSTTKSKRNKNNSRSWWSFRVTSRHSYRKKFSWLESNSNGFFSHMDLQVVKQFKSAEDTALLIPKVILKS